MKLNVKIGQSDAAQKMAALRGVLNEGYLVDEAGALLLNRIRTRFLSAIDTDEKPWPVSRAAIRRGGKTLYATGRLFHSIQLHRTGENTAAIGTDVEYGPQHQFGLGHLPKREFLGASDKDALRVTELLARRIRNALKD